ncbi:MAG: MoxR family ATPase [Phycisphaerales bacterium]|nr:MoxR family ATPase [Phycisphaerales bacterium]
MNLIPPPESDPTTMEAVHASVQQVHAGIAAMRAEIAGSVMGQSSVVDQVLCCVLADGHALLEGVPGTGKTLLVRTIAAATGLDMGRVQFTPDLMPADITGTTVMAESASGRRASIFRPGPIFHGLLLADEINRASPRTQSALLEAMEERRVTVAGRTHPLPERYSVHATQNPIEQEGTHRLPEAQIDRFMMKIIVPPPQAQTLERIIGSTTGTAVYEPQRCISPEFLCAATRLSRRILLAPHVNDWIAALVIGTGDTAIGGDVPDLLIAPCSPRAAIAVRRTSQVAALTAGRLAVSCADVRAVLPSCLRHRMSVSPAAKGRNLTPDDLVDMLLEAVPSPAEEVMN